MFKKKFRWFLEIDFPSGKFGPFEVKVAARPSLKIEQKELSDGQIELENQGWTPLVTSFYTNDSMGNLFDLIAKVFPMGIEDVMPEIGKISMKMYDGCDLLLEEWIIENAWLKSVYFSDVDFSTSDSTYIELVWRYNEVHYIQPLS